MQHMVNVINNCKGLPDENESDFFDKNETFLILTYKDKMF